MTIKTKNGAAVIQTDENDAQLLTDVQSALDMVATVQYETGCECIAMPKSAIVEDFFVLSTGIAGEILQKFVNYRVRLAIFGDFSHYTSKPLRDFIYESNNGSHIFFVENEDEAVAKLASVSGAQLRES